MLTGYATVDTAVECTKSGVFKFLEKPYAFEKLVEIIKETYETRLKKKSENSKRRMDEIQKLSFGQSPLEILRALAHFA